MRVVAFAYACEPDRGSEPGAGWAWARMLATLGTTCVITRANNRPAIEAAVSSTPEAANLTFVYVDLPRWARFWKRGQRGIRLYYLLWQFAALRRARALHRQSPFDLAWHLTLANVWLGSTAVALPCPLVFGPVGGGVPVIWPLLPALGPAGAARELVRATSRALARGLNPLARLAWRRARLILTLNPETRDWLPVRYRAKAAVLPNAVMAHGLDGPRRPRDRGPRTVLFAARLVPSKGGTLAVRAIASLPGWRLLVCGEGPDQLRMRRLAKKLSVENQIDFAGWVQRDELFRIMRDEADVFVFPSLHDQSPWVLHEARTAGLPVVCLEGAGATLLATVIVPPAGVRRTAAALARGIEEATSMPDGPPTEFQFNQRLQQLSTVLADAGLLRVASQS